MKSLTSDGEQNGDTNMTTASVTANFHEQDAKVSKGTVEVDSAQLLLIDPCYLKYFWDWPFEMFYNMVCRLSHDDQQQRVFQLPGNNGVVMLTGGDGPFEVRVHKNGQVNIENFYL